MIRRGEHGDRGSAAVEFALVAPVMLMLLFGMVTGGLSYSDHLSIANAVREGARFGAAIDYTNPSWATSVRTRVQQVYFNDADTLTDEQVCVALVTGTGATLASVGTGCGVGPAHPTEMASGSCAVKIWVRKPQSIVLVVAPPLEFDIGAQSVSYYGRTSGSCTAE